jgi:hypothetical protein
VSLLTHGIIEITSFDFSTPVSGSAIPNITQANGSEQTDGAAEGNHPPIQTRKKKSKVAGGGRKGRAKGAPGEGDVEMDVMNDNTRTNDNDNVPGFGANAAPLTANRMMETEHIKTEDTMTDVMGDDGASIGIT